MIKVSSPTLSPAVCEFIEELVDIHRKLIDLKEKVELPYYNIINSTVNQLSFLLGSDIDVMTKFFALHFEEVDDEE